ncbi:hypothetical protein J6590_078334 [Homalodisca vitripennis]|nr:hypothetical protein J6590_078334 [Homalodisca vitripennis]
MVNVIVYIQTTPVKRVIGVVTVEYIEHTNLTARPYTTLLTASAAGGKGPRPSETQVRPSRRQSPTSSIALAPVVEDELHRII